MWDTINQVVGIPLDFHFVKESIIVAFVYSGQCVSIWLIYEDFQSLKSTALLVLCIYLKYGSNLMFVDPCIVVQFMKKNPTKCNNVSKCYYSLFIWSSTCFGQHAAHHQEPKTALAASGFSYVEGCWVCGWWTLSGTVPALCLTTSNNLPRMKNQRLPVQF